MEYGISLNSVVPVRSEPSHTSTMVTQILFGEHFRVTEQRPEWLRVKLAYDHYEGWVDIIQVTTVSEAEYHRLDQTDPFVSAGLVEPVLRESSGETIPIVLGSSLPGLNNNRFTVGNDTFLFDGPATGIVAGDALPATTDPGVLSARIIGDARRYLFAPYLWGGRSPFGLDCSGFVQMVFKINHIKLLRDACQQAEQGLLVPWLAEAVPGDLAFFDNKPGVITHVGLLIDSCHIIHCSGNVHIDTVDHEGIFNQEQNRYTHHLRLVRRLIGTELK